MKKLLPALIGLILLGLTASRLLQRYRQEQADQRVLIYADWAEVQQSVARLRLSNTELLKRLKDCGVGGILIGVSTVADYRRSGMTFQSDIAANLVRTQMLTRGLTNVSVVRQGDAYTLQATGLNWESLDLMDLGYNVPLIHDVTAQGIHVMLRVEQDGWAAKEVVFSELGAIVKATPGFALLFSSDQLPGGMNAVPEWTEWVQTRDARIPFFEFKPAKGARVMSARSPHLTRRAHTIPTSELKDMLPEMAHARWMRAVRDRGCRYLLFHMAPEETLGTYTDKVQALRNDLSRAGFKHELPEAVPQWKILPRGNTLRSLMCLLLAVLVPPLALRLGRGGTPWKSFFSIFLWTVLGASMVAALADTAWTRLQIVPFRGIKAAVVLAWSGCFWTLFSAEECRQFLQASLRRLDVLLLAVAGGAFLYLLLRTGNSGAAWKSGWEQGFRDTLETWLIARPRFKEFAIGYPLLILGLHHAQDRAGRLLIGLGMIGPISVVNTFCHLHSPLYLAYWRTANGIVLGLLFGFLFLRLRPWPQSH